MVSSLFSVRTILYDRFGRKKEVCMSWASSSWRDAKISSLTFWVAVAVSAITGGRLITLWNWLICLYAGLKSCPHCEIQWASSTANNEIGKVFSRSVTIGLRKRSGERYKSLMFPNAHWSKASINSFSFIDPWIDMARMFLLFKAETWSIIKATKGLTTTQMPSCRSAVSWKHNDLPPPVGSTTKVFLPERDASIASSCPGLKSDQPQCFCKSLRAVLIGGLW